MRVNIYAEEMTERVEIISKEIEGQTFTGLRLYLELPVSYFHDGRSNVRPATSQDEVQSAHIQGPFIHRPGDDDSAAVTFWGKRDLRDVLKIMLEKLDEHYGESTAPAPLGEDILREILREAIKRRGNPAYDIGGTWVEIALAAMTELARRMNGGGE